MARPHGSISVWTSEKTEALMTQFRTGAPMKVIAAELNVSEHACYYQLTKLRAVGVDLPSRLGPPRTEHQKQMRSPRRVAATSAKSRTCLGCQKPFLSAHSMNRLCPACHRKTQRESSSPYAL